MRRNQPEMSEPVAAENEHGAGIASDLRALLKEHPADPDLIEAVDESTKDRDRVRELIDEWNRSAQRA